MEFPQQTILQKLALRILAPVLEGKLGQSDHAKSATDFTTPKTNPEK